MILSVSRRTDIPAFYSDWFFNRIKAGFVDVRNPMNIHRITHIHETSLYSIEKPIRIECRNIRSTANA